QYPERYDTYHHEFGYKRVNNVANKTATLAAILKNKNIIIGGGGLWGLDVNPNILLLSGLLFVSRWVFRKRVYLLGVGYYNSTSRLGRLSAWLAGKSANCIVARDPETLQNFSKINKRTVMDRDIAWHIHNLNLEPYRSDFLAFNAARPIRGKTLFITLRQFKSNQRNDYARLVEACVAKNQKLNIVVALMEPKAVDPEG